MNLLFSAFIESARFMLFFDFFFKLENLPWAFLNYCSYFSIEKDSVFIKI